MASAPAPAMATRIVVCYENQEHTLAFNKGSDATVVDRAISIACGIPLGSVTRLVDASGAVYAAVSEHTSEHQDLGWHLRT